MDIRERQRGLTLIGFLMVAVVVAIFVVVGARMVPAYVEYFSVQKSIEKSLNDARDPGSLMEVRQAFSRYLATDYIFSVNATDLQVIKEGTTTVASVAWTRILPLVANVSLYIEFEARAVR
jgi:Tfp pilus assembly protein PilE